MGIDQTKNNYTVGEWADLWERTFAPPQYARKSLESIRDCRNRLIHNCPEFEKLALSEVAPFHFQKCLNTLYDRGYSKSTISHVKTTYSRIFASAIDSHLRSWNPIEGCVVNKAAPVKKVRALDLQEQQAFEKALSALPVRDQFALEAFLITGLRRSELIGLQWSDWDKERGILLIRKSKTAAGMRTVPVIPELAYILTYLETQRREEDPPQIFTYTGRGMKGTYKQMPSHHLRWICEKTARLADVRHVHPHMLRHTFASRMVENKVDIKSLATIIGHSDPAFTLRQYVDVDETEHLHKEMMRISSFGKDREN